MQLLDIRADLKPLTRRFSELQKRQVPFATAQALTAVARLGQAAEQAAMPSIFDRPTPFTVKSIAVKPARKASLTAVVFVKDIAAEYLEPFTTGAPHFLGSKQALLAPVGQRLNQYGNIPRTTLARLKSKPNVFVGPVVTKAGRRINGVWQRPSANAPKGKRSLKLLIVFEDPKPVTKHFDFAPRILKIAKANIRPEFNKAMVRALATAK